VTVPLHRELDRGTLRSILRAAEITIERFKELLV
jgi:predicted RNA binding protein YcfA (HicA-like mRNA interferase family)